MDGIQTSAMDKQSKSGRHVSVHPLAIITICDHHTIVSMGSALQDPKSRILGLLFGVQDGLQVSIMDACEVQYSVNEETQEIKFSPDVINSKKSLYTAVYSNYELLGWYSVGTDVTPNDLLLHKSMAEWNESPLYLLLNPSAIGSSKDIPISLYESELHVVNDIPTMIFVTIDFKLETAQTERIAVERVVKATPNNGEASIDLHIDGVSTSLKALASRIKLIQTYLQCTKAGKVTPDYRLLRMAASISNKLPAMDSPNFREEFLNEYNDTLVITYLASITKTTNSINDLADKFLATHGERHRRSF